VTNDELLVAGEAALAAGRWDEARTAFEEIVAGGDSAAAEFGLASALWWLGDSHACVDHGARAHALFRRAGDADRAVQSAIWLAMTYKANFANSSAANGWLARADRVLAGSDSGLLRGWSWLAHAYRMEDLDRASELTRRALAAAQRLGDVDLELTALSQLGLIHVGQGDASGGFAMIDEATAAALAGERSTLDTVVYACCDMMNACELASDVERAVEWCRIADRFVESYGCPYLYAECRIYYGSVLTATGRWADADRELRTGLRLTDGTCPGLHGRALVRLAGLRIRQGRLEEASKALTHATRDGGDDVEANLSRAALALARGDARQAARFLDGGLPGFERHRTVLAAALDLLVDARLAIGDVAAATDAAGRLMDTSAAAPGGRALDAQARAARGRVGAAAGKPDDAAADLRAAISLWTALGFPYEQARARFELGRVLSVSHPEAGVEQARRALASFERVGAAVDADRVAAFLRSVGVTPRTGRRTGKPLTQREQEVLDLLACGLTNPEIAERLHVSRKTASHHVSSILTKLDLRNRAEAAAHAATINRTGSAS
jgi:ATP/maltotriose-dependent transcriptional regulator MalT